MFSLAFERHHAATRLNRRASGCGTPTGLPSPGLAAVLGFIPGVGAMYNGEFAKGFIHVLIFATLIWMTDHVSGIFGLGIAAFVIYMPIEAYQTAQGPRDGIAGARSLRLQPPVRSGSRTAKAGAGAPASAGDQSGRHGDLRDRRCRPCLPSR